MLKFLDRFTVSLGVWFGTPVFLHWSWFLMLAYMSWGDLSTGIAYAGIIGIVILHEFGHVLMNKYYGFSAASITMYPIGGVAALKGMPSSAKGEFMVAVAGPAVNVLLIVPLYFWWDFNPTLNLVIAGNAVLLIFNLIPAFPMDGGRVFRAMLWPWLGYYKATMAAVFIGRVFAGIFVGFGLYYQIFSLTLIGLFVWFASGQEQRRVRFFDAVKGLHQYMVAEPSPPVAAMTVQQSEKMLDDIGRKINAALGR